MPSLTNFPKSPPMAELPDDNDAWKDAPILTGSTKFESLPDVKNILITGGAGFIASWLVRHLTLTYPDAYNIISFDKLDYCSTLNNTKMLDDNKNFKFYRGDITNPDDVMDCMVKHDIDTIFHFAAQSHVDLSFGNSYAFTHTNVYGTHVLLQCAKTVGVKKFIHISTDEVYGEVEDDADDLLETSILCPTNPYAASKAAAEMLVRSYQKSFKIPIIIVRSNNVYGPHQYPEKIVPKFSCLLQRGQPVMLHGDGTPTRRYLYAGDAADAFDTILHKGAVDEVYNVGSYDEISNLTLCSKLLACLNIPHKTQEQLHRWVKHTRDRPFNDHRYAVDGTKLRQLGWDQKTSFAKGLAITVDWYRQFGERWWGDISHALTPFPTVLGKRVLANDEPVEDFDEDILVTSEDSSVVGSPNKRKLDGNETDGILQTTTMLNMQSDMNSPSLSTRWDAVVDTGENGEGLLAKRRKIAQEDQRVAV